MCFFQKWNKVGYLLMLQLKIEQKISILLLQYVKVFISLVTLLHYYLYIQFLLKHQELIGFCYIGIICVIGATSIKHIFSLTIKQFDSQSIINHYLHLNYVIFLVLNFQKGKLPILIQSIKITIQQKLYNKIIKNML